MPLVPILSSAHVTSSKFLQLPATHTILSGTTHFLGRPPIGQTFPNHCINDSTSFLCMCPGNPATHLTDGIQVLPACAPHTLAPRTLLPPPFLPSPTPHIPSYPHTSPTHGSPTGASHCRRPPPFRPPSSPRRRPNPHHQLERLYPTPDGSITPPRTPPHGTHGPSLPPLSGIIYPGAPLLVPTRLSLSSAYQPRKVTLFLALARHVLYLFSHRLFQLVYNRKNEFLSPLGANHSGASATAFSPLIHFQLPFPRHLCFPNYVWDACSALWIIPFFRRLPSYPLFSTKLSRRLPFS